MEKIENNEEAVVSNSKIVPKELVALGFPSITKNTYIWDAWDEIISNFYNHLYTLAKLYEKYTSKKLKLSASIVPFRKHSHTIFLDGKEVFSCRPPNRNNNSKNLQRVVDIVKELIPLAGGFENLKQEFAELYKKEKVKYELNEIEFYHSGIFETEAEREEEYRLIEALKNDKELAEKEAFYIEKPIFFGKRHSIREKNLLEDTLGGVLYYGGIKSIRIYKNFLVIGTLTAEYVVKLSKAEKQRVLNIFTLLKL